MEGILLRHANVHDMNDTVDVAASLALDFVSWNERRWIGSRAKLQRHVKAPITMLEISCVVRHTGIAT